MSAPRRARGFTLMELLVSLAISLLTVAAAMTLLVQQQRTYVATSADRAQQESGRLALQDLVGKLKQAGFGVDPNLALDFGENTGNPGVAPRSNLAGAGGFVKVTSFKCDKPIACRDRTDGSDELVFYSRDPWFQRIASKVDTDQLTLVGELKRPILKGQILQVSCLGGSRVRAYVTVKDVVAAAAEPDPTKDVTVTLEAGAQDAAGREIFPFENAQLKDGCFGETGAGLQPVVTVVDRYRYYIGWYGPDGKEGVDPLLGTSRPYLMLDQGLTDASGAAVLSPVAPDVEDLQLAYYYPPAAAGGAPRLIGAAEGVALDGGFFKMQADVTPPGMDDLFDSAPRLTGHPANVQAVRVSVVVRDERVDLGSSAALPPLGNRKETKAAADHRRTTFETTVLLRNLASTYYLYPVTE